jgi:ATP-binding cassette subfamily F protein 2
MKRYHKEQDDIAHIKAFVASCGTYSNLVRQAKSKLKIIEKMEEKGLTEAVDKDFEFHFTFPKCDKLPTPVVAFDDVAFAYSGKMSDALYKDGTTVAYSALFEAHNTVHDVCPSSVCLRTFCDL